MTADREQTRRDAELERKNAASGISGCDAIWPFDQVKAYLGMKEWAEFLLAELGQAERERDEAQENRRDLSAENSALRSRLAKVPALVEALREIAHVVKTRSTGVRMDGATEWPTPMHGQVYELADEALAVWEQDG